MKRLLTYIIIVLVLSACTTKADHARMRSGLDSINVLNRNGQPFTIADVQPYVQFFDDHGTANDRLLAHYLLGRAYHEAGEAPMALECYQHSLECADTTAADCDYAQLARVYGQIAGIFYSQNLYEEQLTYTKQSVRYAWQGKDTLLALTNYEQEAYAYEELNHKDSAIAVIEEVSMLYDTLGCPARAATSLGGVIRIYLDESEYGKAKSSIERYEKESGLFSPNGDIEQGREIFYKIKGLYFLYTNKLDSAEFYFRKELRTGKDFNNQNAAARGLTLLYQRLQNPDSVAKYSVYAYALNDSIYARMETKTVERMHAMYDYSRHQELAHKESEKVARTQKLLLMSVSALMLIILIATWLYIASKQLKAKLLKMRQEQDRITVENVILKQDATKNLQQISQNEERIKQLERKLGKYGKLIFFKTEKTDEDMMDSFNYRKIRAKGKNGQLLTDSDWTTISSLLHEYIPGFYDFISTQTESTLIEYQIAALLRLHLKNGEIANMIGVSAAYISKISSEMYRRYYDRKGSTKELSKELCKIY